MNLLIIANPGPFSQSIKDLLSENFKIDIGYVDKDLQVSSNIKKIQHILSNKNYNFDFLIYLSGETRKENLMMKLNKDLLLEISNLCKFKKMNLIYISSIAVYGIPRNSLVTKNSIRRPINFYGQTKNEADINLMKKNRNILIFNLLPSSIMVTNSKKGFYFKLKKLMNNKIVKMLLLILCPGGQFSFCTSEDIANEIQKSIIFAANSNKKGYLKNINYFEKIISKEIKVRDIFYDSNNLYPLITLPTINLKFLSIIFRFLDPNMLLRIIFLFSNVEYKNIKPYF